MYKWHRQTGYILVVSSRRSECSNKIRVLLYLCNIWRLHHLKNTKSGSSCWCRPCTPWVPAQSSQSQAWPPRSRWFLLFYVRKQPWLPQYLRPHPLEQRSHSLYLINPCRVLLFHPTKPLPQFAFILTKLHLVHTTILIKFQFSYTAFLSKHSPSNVIRFYLPYLVIPTMLHFPCVDSQSRHFLLCHSRSDRERTKQILEAEWRKYKIYLRTTGIPRLFRFGSILGNPSAC